MTALQSQLDAMRETAFRLEHGTPENFAGALFLLLQQQLVFNAMLLTAIEARSRA
ncbi:MAG: hypothetical protein ACREF4_21990 [Gammaproteobacteria bacterium]